MLYRIKATFLHTVFSDTLPIIIFFGWPTDFETTYMNKVFFKNENSISEVSFNKILTQNM